MAGCISGARFNMKADVLRQFRASDDDPATVGVDESQFEYVQDPDSGEIIRKWTPTPDNPSTPDVDEAKQDTIRCIARGIIDGGIRVAGTTEDWGKVYDNVDYVRISFPINANITKRDRVTNIRGSDGTILWRDEEVKDSPPTIFNVMGVTPIPDPFGRPMEAQALLQRAENRGTE